MLVIHERGDIGSANSHSKMATRNKRKSPAEPGLSASGVPLLLRQWFLPVISKQKLRNSMEFQRLAAIERELNPALALFGSIWLSEATSPTERPANETASLPPPPVIVSFPTCVWILKVSLPAPPVRDEPAPLPD